MSALSAYFSEGCEFKFVLCAPFSYLDDHVTIRGIFDRKKNIFPNLLSFLKEQKQVFRITIPRVPSNCLTTLSSYTFRMNFMPLKTIPDWYNYKA